MLSFPVTIRPYHEHVRPPRLRQKVVFNRFLVFCNLCLHRSIEQLKGFTRSPFSVGVVEVMFRKMPNHRGDGEECPCLGVIKFVVLDKVALGIMLLWLSDTYSLKFSDDRTYCGELATRKDLSDRFGY